MAHRWHKGVLPKASLANIEATGWARAARTGGLGFHRTSQSFDLDAPDTVPVTRRTRKPAESNSALLRALRVKPKLADGSILCESVQSQASHPPNGKIT